MTKGSKNTNTLEELRSKINLQNNYKKKKEIYVSNNNKLLSVCLEN